MKTLTTLCVVGAALLSASAKSQDAYIGAQVENSSSGSQSFYLGTDFGSGGKFRYGAYAEYGRVYNGSDSIFAKEDYLVGGGVVSYSLSTRLSAYAKVALGKVNTVQVEVYDDGTFLHDGHQEGSMSSASVGLEFSLNDNFSLTTSYGIKNASIDGGTTLDGSYFGAGIKFTF